MASLFLFIKNGEKKNNSYADHSYFSILYIIYKQKNKIVITSAAIYIVVKIKFILKYNITATKCKIVSIIEKQFSYEVYQ